MIDVREEYNSYQIVNILFRSWIPSLNISVLKFQSFKVEAKCSIACYKQTNQNNTLDYSNISSIIVRTLRGYRLRDKENNDEETEAKRQRRNIARRWAANKGNDLIENDDDNRW